MYNPSELYSVAAQHSLQDHWHQYNQEIQNSYIPVPQTFEEYPSALNRINPNVTIGLIPFDYKRHGELKKGPTTRSKSATALQKKASATRKLRKSENQLDVLKKYFKTNSKPGRESVDQLAKVTGLNFLEVRNWFRNARLRNKDGQMSMSPREDDDGIGEVSSSTGVGSPLDQSSEILQIWDKLEGHEKIQLLPKYFASWEKDGTDRTEAIKSVLKCLTTTERNMVQSYVKPRGPYRCSGDKSLSKTTILERAKNAWRELERMFGANKRDKQPVNGYQENMALNLDRDMLEGLKSLFQAHRDYLHYLVKEMGINTSEDKEMGKMGKTPTIRAYGTLSHNGTITTEEEMQAALPQYGSGQMDMVPAYSLSPHMHSSYQSPASGYPIIPTTPTPLYPTADFMPYSYNAYQNSPLQPSSSIPPTSPFARTSWVPPLSALPAHSEERGLAPKSYYTPDTPDYSFVRNHFSPEKLPTHQPEAKSIMKQFPELGGMSFNYNNMHSSSHTNTEITQKCTFVKYYEVTYNKSAGGPSQGNKSLQAPNNPSSKLEQLI